MRLQTTLAAAALALPLVTVTIASAVADAPRPERGFDHAIAEHAESLFRDGLHIFRDDTFGDEAFWGGTLKLHQAMEHVSPLTALAVGLKVDVDRVPAPVLAGLKSGTVNLNDPANTLALLDARAVVGVTAHRGGDGHLTSIGIQCALCHSTVDNSFAPGIGHRLDGWANRDLNVGAIVALSPDLGAVVSLLRPAIPQVDEKTVRAVLNSWGPGKFDAELFMDGKAFRPDGRSAATLIPPAFGLAGVNLHTYTGWGSVPYWNAFVANLEMHGSGTFFDPRLEDAAQFPVAAAAGFNDVRSPSDEVTAKLAALHFYQLSIPAPRPPAGSFDATAASRGRALFDGAAKCSTCHVPPLFSEPGWGMHTGAEIGIDDFQADRSPDHRYRTTPLKGLWSHAKGGFYHDGRFATLADVVRHYDRAFGLHLGAAQVSDLVEYLKSL